MEYFKMYTIPFLILMLLGFSLSVDFNIKFKERQPNVVLVGGNVTYTWTYDVETIQPDVIFSGIWDSQATLVQPTFGRYVPDYGKTQVGPPGVKGYCSSFEWTVNTTKRLVASKMVNITMGAHDKTIALRMVYGQDGTDQIKPAPDKIFISVPPVVELAVSNTNVTAGDLVTIECKILKGRPSPSFKWYHDNKLMEEETGRFLLNNEEIPLKYSGSYKCTGNNNAGESPQSSVINVVVHKKEGSGDKPDTNERDGEGRISNGSILGIVFALLALVIIGIIIGILWFKLKKTKTSKTVNANGDDTKTRMVPEPTEKDQVWL